MKKSNIDNAEIKTEQKSVLFWLIMAFVVLFLFIAPYKQGLFNAGLINFERPIYTAFIWSSVALFLLCLYFFYHWKLQDHRDLFSIAVWLVPLSYLLSLFNAASYHSAMNGVYIHIIYAIFFLIGAYFARSKFGLNIVIHAIVISGYVLVMYGLMNWLGNAEYKDAVLSGRLSNVFQYPNSYAAYLIGLLFSSLILVHTSKRWYNVALHASMLAPIMLSFLLTYSRGGLLVLPIILLIYLAMLPWARQIVNLVYLFVSGISSIFLYTRFRDPISNEVSDSSSIGGWFTLLGLSIGISVIIYVIQRYWGLSFIGKYQDFKPFHIRNFIIPLSFIIVGILGLFILFGDLGISKALPGAVRERIESINLQDYSVITRAAYYRDSIDLWKDYPLFGAGGGAWSGLYEQYKSYPYLSNQAHNFFLQYLVEVGLVGLIILLLLFAAILFIFIRYYLSHRRENETHLIFFIITISILIHSIIDFDMSFVYLGALIFLSLGGMASVFNTDIKLLLRWTKPQWWNKTYPLLLCMCSIVIFIASIQILKANSTYTTVINLTGDERSYNTVSKKIDQALNLQPNHPNYVIMKVGLLEQAYEQTKEEHYYVEALNRLDQIKQKEPYHRHIVEEEYKLYMMKDDLKQAADLVAGALNKFPWDIVLYERKITLNAELGSKAREQNLTEEMDVYWKIALETYNTALQKKKHVEEMPSNLKTEDWWFQITPNIALSLGQIYAMQGDYKAASSLLSGSLSSDLDVELNREIARWYLAALQKQGMNDEAQLESLLNKDPMEQEKIQTIIDKIEDMK
jgi:tetratricopeptide (TPR) repeat protein